MLFGDDLEPEDDPVSPVDVVEPEVPVEPESDEPDDEPLDESLDAEEDDVVEAAEVLPRLSVL